MVCYEVAWRPVNLETIRLLPTFGWPTRAKVFVAVTGTEHCCIKLAIAE